MYRIISHIGAVSLLLAGLVGPQLASAQCQQTVTNSDATCTSGHNCISTTGCVSHTFIALCTGWYKFEVWTECGAPVETEKCYHYQSCTNIVDDSGNNKNCHTTNCNNQDCDHSCNNLNPSAVCLTANNSYTIFTCLIACSGGTCPTPTSGTCKAYSLLSFTGTACPW
jgi:hypothetical protein